MLREGTPNRRRLAIASFGYGVVGVFLLAFAIIEKFWNETFSRQEAFVIAALVAIPPALPFLWDRLSRVKLFEFELELSGVTAGVTLALPEALRNVDPHLTLQYSYAVEIARKVSDAIQNTAGSKLAVIHLGIGKTWWVTRLFLLAALLMDYTDIRTLLLLSDEGHRKRLFVGMTSPSRIRNGLAADFPILETAYRQASLKIVSMANRPDLHSVGEIENMVVYFGEALRELKPDVVKSDPGSDEPVLRRPQQVEWATAYLARQFLETDPTDQSIHWDDGPPSPLLYYRIIDRKYPFVVLVCDGQLREDGLVVDRQALATQIATGALQQYLERPGAPGR